MKPFPPTPSDLSLQRPHGRLLRSPLCSSGRPVWAFSSVLAVLVLASPISRAATRTKQNNSSALNLAVSWDALPSTADIAQWTSTVTTANSPVLGADLSLLGLKIVNPGGPVALGAGNVLTLGASGVDLSTATQDLTLNCGLSLQGAQSWTAAAGRSLNVGGVLTRSGATVDFTNFNPSAILGTLTNDASGILGLWATTGAATSLNYVRTNAGVISIYSGQTAAAADLSNVTNPSLHYSFAAAATQVGAITANTLRFTGSGGTLANAGFTTTLNGLMNAGSGSLTVSGAGDLMVGTNRELVILSNAQATTIATPIINSSAGVSSVTYTGATGGILTLSNANTYSGGIVVNSGTVMVGDQNSFGSGPIKLMAGCTLQQVNFEGNNAGGALPNTVVLGGIGNVTLNLPFGGGKDVWLSQVVSGTGGITVQGGGRKLTLTGSNTFSGGLRLTNDGNTVQISHANALGSGAYRSESTLNNSTLVALTNLATGTGVGNAFDIAAGCYLNIDTSGDGGDVSLLLSGPISSSGGVGGISKLNSGTLTLTGANTYTGSTKVSGGTLALSSAGSLGGGALDIGTGATVALNFSGTRHVSALTLGGGAANPAGTYGAVGSGAGTTSAFFTGTGTVTVGGSAFAVTTTNLTLTTGTNPAGVGATLTFTATVTGGSPTGNVTFYDGVTLIGTQPLNGASQATYTTSTLTLGNHPITARYAGSSTTDPSVSAVTSLQVTNPTDILNFTFPSLPATTIAGTDITVTVPYSTNVTTLAPTYSLASGSTCLPASGTSLNFSGPQNYTVSASGFPDKTYKVTVTKAPASSDKNITSFVFPGLPTTTISTNTVSVTVPFGTAVANLSPTFTTSPLASGSPASGAARNFSSPQTYTITAEDSSPKTYTVSVTVAAASSAKDILSCDFGSLGPATISGTSITLTVPPNQSVSSLSPTFVISNFATLNPGSGSAQNFTTPQTYTVTAQNGTTKSYTVAVQSYETWTNSASFFILTTPDGANLPAATSETNFPLLLRLNATTFNFSQAQTDGRDIRFTTLAGTPLAYQIEQWDAGNSTAAIWVKIPTITGNARQEIKMYWGKLNVLAESSGTNVFNSTNGYVSVMHLNESVADSVGTLNPTNIGTVATTGLIGKGRTFASGNGINGGDNLTSLPSGNTSHSTQLWFKSDSSGFDLFDWAREDAGKKVQIRLVSPPQIVIDGNFASVNGVSILATSQWHHVVNTYTPGNPGITRIYIDGQLDASASVVVDITPPSILRLGGWYDTYKFTGQMDEARLSKFTRSANWIKMEYENQKAQQTLVGNLVQTGNVFAVTPSSATLQEGTTVSSATTTTLVGQAGGAQKVTWIEKRNGVDTVLATDVFSLPVTAGRVTGNTSYIIQFQAVYPTGTQTINVPINLTEALPDPVFTLTGPTTWDGRQTIVITPTISNLTTLQSLGIANLTYTWTVSGVAVAKQITTGTPTVPGTLTLTRSQNSGPMTVKLVLNNGGSSVTASKTITVTEPASDPWVQRTPGANEIPVDNQFYARDDSGMGKIYYNGTQSGTPDRVFLKVYTTGTGSDVLYSSQSQSLVAGKYAFTAPINPGRVTYKVTYGTTTGATDTVLKTVTNLVCGDAYIFEGQSNALAIDSLPGDTTTDAWVRTYGNGGGGWGNAVRNGSQWTVGYFAFDLALSLTTTYNMPICIINGAIGGTRIDQHQANPVDHTLPGSEYSIYANLLNRVIGAKLTHGIRGIIWHQGESNSGADSPTGDFDYKSYQQYFVDMSAAWKQDYPNFQRYTVFQVMPKPCSLGPKGDQQREASRTLPLLFSKMDILNTLALPGYIGCHFTAAGYKNVADRTLALMKQRYYGVVPPQPVTAPNLKRAYFTTSNRNEIALEFDQDMSWNTFSKANYYLDKVSNKVTSGTATGKIVTLQLSVQATATSTLDYLRDDFWNFGESVTSLLFGANTIPALTFADVPIAPPAPTSLIATAGNAQVSLAWTASVGATGYNVKRSITNGGPYTVVATSAGVSYTDTSVTNGTLYYYVVSATTAVESLVSNQVNATPVAPISSYISWASDPAQGLTAGVNDRPLDDPDRDGISNLLEFTLGGGPLVSSQSILPKLTTSGGSWFFEYDRSDLSITPATTQIVEYGSDLTGWTSVTIPATSSGIVAIAPGSPSDRVRVTLPVGGNRQFARLKISQ